MRLFPAPVTSDVPVLPPTHQVPAHLALWLLLRTSRCRLLTSSLFCSLTHRGMSRGGFDLGGSFPTPSLTPVPGEFGHCRLVLRVLFTPHGPRQVLLNLQRWERVGGLGMTHRSTDGAGDASTRSFLQPKAAVGPPGLFTKRFGAFPPRSPAPQIGSSSTRRWATGKLIK